MRAVPRHFLCNASCALTDIGTNISGEINGAIANVRCTKHRTGLALHQNRLPTRAMFLLLSVSARLSNVPI